MSNPNLDPGAENPAVDKEFENSDRNRNIIRRRWKKGKDRREFDMPGHVTSRHVTSRAE